MNNILFSIMALLFLASFSAAYVFYDRANDVKKEFEQQVKEMKDKIKALDEEKAGLEAKLKIMSMDRDGSLADKKTLESDLARQNEKIEELSMQIEAVRKILRLPEEKASVPEK